MLYAKIPRYMKDNNLRLRPLRIFDGPFIGEGLRDGSRLEGKRIEQPNIFIMVGCLVVDKKDLRDYLLHRM